MAASKKTYATEQAQVRTGTDLCQQENNFTSTRISHVKASLEKILNIPLTDKQVPRIAICASGGGYRAALTMLGALDGSDMPIAQNGSKNLLDITTYLAAVSGSASVAAGMAYTHKTPSESINHIAPLINKSLLSDFSMVDLALALKRKTQHGQSISFIDLFGSLMAQRTFKGLGIDHPSSIDLATYASQIDPLKSPLPIQTSIIGNNTSGKYEWVEFTPFEIGSTFLNTFIPSWAFGRKFENGLSIDFTPPQSLAFCMGLWGSAMCANPHDFFKIRIAPELDPIVSSFVAPQLEQLFTRPPFSNVRLSPAHVFNWNLGMQNATLNKHKTLTLVDAGFDSNFPLPPLLRSERAVDIIIMIDASTIRANELRDAEKNMLHRGLDMPSIDYGIIDQPCSIHHDSLSPNKSTIVYIPLVKNPSYHDNWDPCKEKFTDIFNFRYTQHQTHALSGLMKHNMAQSMPMIIDTIRQWIKKKNH